MKLNEGKLSGWRHKYTILMMLAAYLFLAFGDVNIEAMHTISHAWQSATKTPVADTHHHLMHEHGHGHHHHHHHHDFLGFFKRLLHSKETNNAPVFISKVKIDKHFKDELKFETVNEEESITIKQFQYIALLTAGHSQRHFPPPKF